MGLAEYVQRTVWPRRGVSGWIGYAALWPLSAAFGAAVGLRDLAYRSGLLRQHLAPLAVISVGNLAVGGTGKTPFTAWLSRELTERGFRVAILLRGYGGRRSGVTVVSRGAGPELGASEVGDEAAMLAKRFSGPVLIAARRLDGARAAAEIGSNVVVLDDAFQHRAIARDVDLVLVDGRRSALLPAGPLRERESALSRADAIIRVERSPGEPSSEPPSVWGGKPVHRMQIEPVSLVRTVAGQWEEWPLGRLAGKRVVAVCGIGQPEGFYELLRQWDATIDEVFEFRDHHAYSAADWQEIARRGHQADLIVTTEKDLVKLEAYPFAAGKLVALRIEPRIERAEDLIRVILAKLREKSQHRAVPLKGVV